uniref:G-protein coupled receptors family 1 profile domain-containing protein n=1 Tax=Romanomermis culicivorax TaxID=13658 RepID=A0A915JA62_ROMCU
MIRQQSTTECLSSPLNDSSALLNATLACHPYVYDACRDRCYDSYRDFRLESFLPLEFAYPIYAVTFPILLVPMIISNIFVVLVLSKKHMASATNTVLLYMAVADLFVGLVPFPFTFFYYNLG